MKNKTKILSAKRKNLTWQFIVANFKTKEVRSVYFQFSLKDPWWLPKYDPHFGKADIPLWGWLFFYFGGRKEGMLCETTNDNAKIIDKNGKKYYFVPVEKIDAGGEKDEKN